MASTYPGAPDDLTTPGLTHGTVSDALAAVQATLGTDPQGDAATVAERLDAGVTIGDELDVEENLSPSDPASGYVRITAVTNEGFDAPDVYIRNSEGNSTTLLTSDSANDAFIQRSEYGIDLNGRMLVSAFGDSIAYLDPGTDGQVLTADSASDYGLTYTDPHILRSTPGGIAYRLVVADDGTLSTEAV